MKNVISAMLLAFVFGISPHVSAADSLVGTYDGTYVVGRGLKFGLRVEITDHNGTSVKGSAIFYQSFCGGTFPFEGETVSNIMKLAVSGSNTCDPRTYELELREKKLIGTLRRGSDIWNIELRQ